MKSAKRVLALFMILVFAVLSLSALDGSVTWYWYINDSKVEFYRYQVDGEEDGFWTVVDKYVDFVTIDLDVSVVHTLYLQQSYDGLVWSASSKAYSEVLTADEPVDQSVDVFDDFFEEEFEDLFEELPQEISEVEDASMVIYETIEIDRYEGTRRLDFGLGYLNAIPNSAGAKMLGGFASYSQTFMQLAAGELGLRANAALYVNKNIVLDIRNTNLVTYLNCLAMVTAKVGNCDLFGAFGPEVSLAVASGAKFNAGVSLEAGVRYNRWDSMSIGLVFSDHQSFVGGLGNRMDMKVFLSKTL